MATPAKYLSNKPKQAVIRKRIAEALTYADKYPSVPLTKVASNHGVSVKALYQARSYAKKKAAVTRAAPIIERGWARAAVSTSPTPVLGTPYEQQVKRVMEARDMVNHPPHYKAGGIETIDFIEAKQLNYNLGNVVKYITRADLKGNRTQDLEKALWYLRREINTIQGVKR